MAMLFNGSLHSMRTVVCRTPFLLATASSSSSSSPLRPMSRHLCSSVPTDSVLIERRNGARTLVLNRPKVLNALDLDMVHTMHKRLAEWEHDDDVRMVIVKGAGGKAFCAGGDVAAIRLSGLDGTSLCHQFFYDEYILDHLIATYQKPYVAILNGITMGGGVGISVHGQFRVCTDNTMFAMPETAIGLFPDVGGGYFLPRLQGQLGMFLALTGHRLKAHDVLHAGIATHYCKKELLPEVEDRLTSLPNKLMIAPVQVEKILNEYQCLSVDGNEMPEFSLKSRMATINRIFDAPSVEELVARLSAEEGEWAKKVHDTIIKMSPTSLKLTHRQIRSGALLNLDVVFTMEYRMVQAVIAAKGDFYEGVRAVLVDKCNSPKWEPSTLEAVDKTMLNSYFKPLGKRDLFIKPIAGQVPKL